MCFLLKKITYMITSEVGYTGDTHPCIWVQTQHFVLAVPVPWKHPGCVGLSQLSAGFAVPRTRCRFPAAADGLCLQSP